MTTQRSSLSLVTVEALSDELEKIAFLKDVLPEIPKYTKKEKEENLRKAKVMLKSVAVLTAASVLAKQLGPHARELADKTLPMTYGSDTGRKVLAVATAFALPLAINAARAKAEERRHNLVHGIDPKKKKKEKDK